MISSASPETRALTSRTAPEPAPLAARRRSQAGVEGVVRDRVEASDHAENVEHDQDLKADGHHATRSGRYATWEALSRGPSCQSQRRGSQRRR